MSYIDWFLLFHLNALGIASTLIVVAVLLLHPEAIGIVFASWVTLMSALIASYQWFKSP